MNIDQVVPNMTNFGSLVVAATGTSLNGEPVDALLDRIAEDDKLVDGLLDRILSSDQLMDRLFLKISSSVNTTTNTEEGKAIASTDGDGMPTVEPMEAASDQQDGSACNGHCGEPSPIVTRFLSRLLDNDNLIDELALRLAKLAKPVDRFITITAAPGMEPMEQVYRDYERGELASPEDDPSKQGQLGRFLQHLFLYELAVLAFWYKLIDDDLFAESMLEPIYSNRYLADLVSERFLDDDRMMEFN